MAIYDRDPNLYSLWVELAARSSDEVVIRREYRDPYGGLVAHSVRLHRCMIRGLIKELEAFAESKAAGG